MKKYKVFERKVESIFEYEFSDALKNIYFVLGAIFLLVMLFTTLGTVFFANGFNEQGVALIRQLVFILFLSAAYVFFGMIAEYYLCRKVEWVEVRR